MPREERLADLMSATEALLFVSDESVSCAKLAEMLEVGASEMDEVLTTLAAEYEEENRGMQLREVAGGWRFFSHPAHHGLIEKYVISWDTRRLSAAALEALAVIAYHQPVTRAGVNAVRGVNSEGVISSLIEKGLVRETGRDKGPGNAILYGTTRAFLEKFGLKTVKDLPPLEDFAPDEASREYIRERLSGMSATAADPAAQLERIEDEDDEQREHYDGPDVRIVDDGGRVVVEEVDRGEDAREDDPQAMAEIIGQSMTEKVDDSPLVGEDLLEDPEADDGAASGTPWQPKPAAPDAGGEDEGDVEDIPTIES